MAATLDFSDAIQGLPLVMKSIVRNSQGDRPAARVGDTTAHGGTVVLGCPTVLIGG